MKQLLGMNYQQLQGLEQNHKAEEQLNHQVNIGRISQFIGLIEYYDSGQGAENLSQQDQQLKSLILNQRTVNMVQMQLINL